MKYVLALALLAYPAIASARKDEAAAICPQPFSPPLFISPMGEPFRPTSDGTDPVKRWFDQADRDHDGRLTIGEMMLDGDRFFATLDKDHSDELLPDEVDAYEENVAPEVRLYQRREFEGGGGRPGGKGGKRGGRGGRGGGEGGGHRGQGGEEAGPDENGASPPVGSYNPFAGSGFMGAGRYSFLNIPNPVASADDDINRAVSKKEFRAAAAERFRDLDPLQKKVLTLADLPKTPAQIGPNRACIARVKAEASGKKAKAQ